MLFIAAESIYVTEETEMIDKQEVRTTDNSRPLLHHIQGHSMSLTYLIENLYTRLPISD